MVNYSGERDNGLFGRNEIILNNKILILEAPSIFPQING